MEFDTGHGKLSAHLDLRQEQDLKTLRDLIAAGGYFLAGLPSGHACRARTFGTRPCCAAPRHHLCLAVGIRVRGTLGGAAWLRYSRSDGERHYREARRAVPRFRAGAAVLSGVGNRLPDRLSHGVWRAACACAPRYGGRQLAGVNLAGADGALACGQRTSA